LSGQEITGDGNSPQQSQYVPQERILPIPPLLSLRAIRRLPAAVSAMPAISPPAGFSRNNRYDTIPTKMGLVATSAVEEATEV